MTLKKVIKLLQRAGQDLMITKKNQMQINMQQRILIFLILLLSTYACKNRKPDLCGKKVKFWLQVPSSNLHIDQTYYGRCFFSNNLGLYYLRSKGVDEYYQPYLYDAKSDRINKSLFEWKLEEDSLFIINSEMTARFKVILLDTENLVLQNNTDTFYYKNQNSSIK